MKRFTLSAIIVAAFVSCGDSSLGTKSSSVEIPKVPDVDPDRPKTGREGILRVPWTPKSQLIETGGLLIKNYLIIREDEIGFATICGAMIDGKRQWHTSKAHAQIKWPRKGSFETVEYDITTGRIGPYECNSELQKGVKYFYQLADAGKTLKLVINDGAKTTAQSYEILRNKP